MVLKLIKSEADHEATLARIDDLMDAEAGTARGDELELLAALVELYENKSVPIDPPSPVDAIRFRMEQSGLRQQDLVPYIGSRSKVSEVLSGRRSLSLRMIRSLHEGLGIPAETLLQEPSRAQSASASSRLRTRRKRRTGPALRSLRRAESLR